MGTGFISSEPPKDPVDFGFPNNPSPQGQASVLDCSVVTLTHYLPPYMTRVLSCAAKQVREFRVLLSIDQEPNRQFGVRWDDLDVRVQKSLMFRKAWKHDAGFQDELYIHVPYDTFGQLRRLSPDIVFSYELGFRSLTSALYCKTHGKRLALCVCVSEHTERGRGIARNLLRRMLLRLADAVTYNGPSCQKYLKSFGVPDQKLFHFPYSPSDSESFTGAIDRSPPVANRLICVGQLNERKGVLPLVRQLAEYCQTRPQTKVELDLGGKGSLAAKILAVPRPPNFQLRLLGYLTSEQLTDALRQVGILVFPTLADEWGLVVNEGLQAGLPVLGSEFAQASTTLIVEGKNGWIYNPHHSAQLYQKLDEIFAMTDEQLAAMRPRCQHSVRHITSMSAANQLVTMFRALSN